MQNVVFIQARTGNNIAKARANQEAARGVPKAVHQSAQACLRHGRRSCKLKRFPSSYVILECIIKSLLSSAGLLNFLRNNDRKDLILYIGHALSLFLFSNASSFVHPDFFKLPTTPSILVHIAKAQIRNQIHTNASRNVESHLASSSSIHV